MPSVRGDDDDALPTDYGVYGRSTRGGFGVSAYSNNYYGVFGLSDQYPGVGVGGFGPLYGVYGQSNVVGVRGESMRNTGVSGYSREFIGVSGISYIGRGVSGSSGYYRGVEGTSSYHTGVYGRTFGDAGAGVHGVSQIGYSTGVYGYSQKGYGVVGYSNNDDEGYFPGVYGQSRYSDGVEGRGYYGVFGRGREAGVRGFSEKGSGVSGYSREKYGVYGYSETNYAGFFSGDVNVTGTLYKSAVRFKIDHPLDPANKYLYHSSIESPDMKNVYDGVVTLDDKGEAEIELPDWFGALNKDFRYQLTAIGAPAPNLHIAEEISDATTTNYSRTRSNKNKSKNSSRFKVAGGVSGMKVSWQVTGIRKDPWANAHRIRVEEDKPDKERGYYIYPELYGQPEEKGISHLLFPTDEEERKKLLINEQNKRPKIKIPSS